MQSELYCGGLKYVKFAQPSRTEEVTMGRLSLIQLSLWLFSSILLRASRVDFSGVSVHHFCVNTSGKSSLKHWQSSPFLLLPLPSRGTENLSFCPFLTSELFTLRHLNGK
jgi:hypothetical protein